MYLSKTFNRKLIGQLLIVLVILIGISIFIPNINIVAHLGGLIGGILITLMGYYFKHNRTGFWIVLIITLVLFSSSNPHLYHSREEYL